MSELDKIIAPEIINDEFYQIISSLTSKEKLDNILEIGSSAGGGSTKAFVEGLSKNPSPGNLYCLEVSKPRFEALKNAYQDKEFVKCYHASSVPVETFPTPDDVAKFYNEKKSILNNYPLDEVLRWREQDIEYLQRNICPQNGIEIIKKENNIDYFDLVLIDGSEFTGIEELRLVYGAKVILLDDSLGYKNLDNLNALKSDPNYDLAYENQSVRNGFAIFTRNSNFKFEKVKKGKEENFPVHFFTIVLNGMPFIQHHVDMLKQLDFEWHWHVIEGVAELTNCTAWSLPTGGSIPSDCHNAGRSNDGTFEYLNKIESEFPNNISIYRKPENSFWNGKVQMCNAPIPYIEKECLLWQIDNDELWSAEQVSKMRSLFLNNSSKTAAYVHCHYFIGPDKYISNLNVWATQAKDWLRVWRFKPGMQWAAHEPPVLVTEEGVNLSAIDPISRDETLAEGLVYEHPSYVLEEQVRFKESYYGYENAVAQWKALQEIDSPVCPADYLHWAKKNGAVATNWGKGPLMFRKYLPNTTKKKSVIIAADLAKQTTQDLTQIALESAFHKAIRNVFQNIKPRKIIETGTYLGNGTTSIISAALKELGIEDAKFFSIEVNPVHLREAVYNLHAKGYTDVKLMHGLSVPKSLLPTLEEIEEQTVRNVEFNDIIVDHDEIDRAKAYFAETDFDVKDDLLNEALLECDYKPDFVLLDSAGCMGNIEFNYLLTKLKAPCFIALDDVKHIKHRRSFLQMHADPRFKVIESSDEKFGFCVAHFDPDVCLDQDIETDESVNSIIWLRGDAIGDAILSMGMLPYVREKYPNAKIHVACQAKVAALYRNCPYVHEVAAYDQGRLEREDAYFAQVVSHLQGINADLLLNSVYSRAPIMEVLAIHSNAKRKIALRGDLSNITSEVAEKVNVIYSNLIESNGDYGLEYFRHKDFLSGLGVNTMHIPATVWNSIEEEVFAEEFYAKHNLNPEKTIVMFAGAQADFRCIDILGKGISAYKDYAVVALGTKAEFDLNQKNGLDFGGKFINTCGELLFTQSVAILKRAALAVGTETSLAHAACAVNVPNVVVIGGGHFNRFMPYSSKTSLVCLPLECFTCGWACKHETHHCLRSIESESISFAIKSTLENTSEVPRVFVQKTSNKGSLSVYPQTASIESFLDASQVEIIEIPQNQKAQGAITFEHTNKLMF